MSWLGLASKWESRWDRTRFRLKHRLGMLDEIVIQPYRGFANDEHVWVKGRVMERSGASQPSADDSAIKNAIRMFRRYESDEVASATVRCEVANKSFETQSNEEGFFEFDLAARDAELGDEGDGMWRSLQLQLENPLDASKPPYRTEAHILRPSDDAELGLISDLDDTIVKTGAYNLVKHWRTVVTSNVHTREMFPGLASFYRALQHGQSDRPVNPVFYVSSSPWNLFDLFEGFMKSNGIPLGPVILKDFGLDRTKLLTGGHQGHKSDAIEKILETYPKLGFILVGDSGQRDARIYADIVERHPGRILAVFIRDVTGDERREELQDLLRKVESDATEVAYGPDLLEAAEIAERRGWITPDAAAQVSRDVQ